MESAAFATGYGPSEGLLCTPCRSVPPPFERAVAYGVYQDELRAMLHLLKYEGMHPVAGLLGPKLAGAMLTLRNAAGPELVVTSVPLFKGKQRSRGYNQSELLARAALRELKHVAPEWRLAYRSDILERRRDTRSQFELSVRGRRWNLRSAFRARPNALRAGCEVLLIDDIYTSGATARECARVLRRAGAARVWVATLARAQRPQVVRWDATVVPAPVGFG